MSRAQAQALFACHAVDVAGIEPLLRRWLMLAHGDCVAARGVAEAGWPMAAAQALQPFWAATLALLAAREGRPRAAALLAGCCEARMSAVGEVLESNEARSLAQAREFAAQALGPAAFEAALAEGALLGDEQLGQVALAVDDSR